MLNTALARAAHRATHDVLICVVTDGAGSDGETVRLVTQLCAHNDVLVVLVRDPLEAELPDAGRLVMAEADRQLEVDTSESVLRRRYAEDSRRRLADAYRLSRQRQIPVLPLDTVDDVAIPLRRLLGKRRPENRVTCPPIRPASTTSSTSSRRRRSPPSRPRPAGTSSPAPSRWWPAGLPGGAGAAGARLPTGAPRLPSWTTSMPGQKTPEAVASA
jgi:hypothetical protein